MNHYNRLVFAGSPYTLRRTPVTPIIAEQTRQGKRIINGMLGDPVAHGLGPYEGFTKAVSEASARRENWGYVPSLGHERLRELIKQIYFKGRDVHIFIGTGVSGINDALDRWALSGAEPKAVAIPRKSYILYFFDAEINGAAVQSIDLGPTGHIDLESLEHTITRDTKIIKLTTTGNPFGTSMDEETVKGIFEIVAAKQREFNHPIFLLFDIMYEGFRHDNIELDLIALAEKYKYANPVFVVDSISKRKIAAPGARLGWLAVHWPEDSFPDIRRCFLNEIETLLLPRLGQVATPIQLGLIRVLSGVTSSDAERAAYEEFDRMHIAEAKRRVAAALLGLAKIDGVIFPDCYYNVPGDQSSGIAVSRVANSFYINFGFLRDQTHDIENPSARKFAMFLAESGLAVVGTTPIDSFLPPEDRGKGGDFMRLVALQPDDIRVELLANVAAYAEHL